MLHIQGKRNTKTHDCDKDVFIACDDTPHTRRSDRGRGRKEAEREREIRSRNSIKEEREKWSTECRKEEMQEKEKTGEQ